MAERVGPYDLDRLLDSVRNLKLEYKDEPQSDLLIRIPNKYPEVRYDVTIVTSEFTSLCPLNSAQPDYATITIHYAPKEWLVELKSLKFYLVAFRMCGIFHEQVPSTILKDLVELLEPKELSVQGDFTVRGGLDTSVFALWDERNGYSKEGGKV